MQPKVTALSLYTKLRKPYSYYVNLLVKMFPSVGLFLITLRNLLLGVGKFFQASGIFPLISLLGLIPSLSYPLQVILIYSIHSIAFIPLWPTSNSLGFWKCFVDYQSNSITKIQLMIPKSFLLILCDLQIEGGRITPSENCQDPLLDEKRASALGPWTSPAVGIAHRHC